MTIARLCNGAAHGLYHGLAMTTWDQGAAVPSTLTTSQLCKAAGVTRGQLRLYEREGLIAPPRRTAAGYRDYGGETQTLLNAIRQLKELGFTLAEIAALLSERDNGEIDPDVLQARAVDLLHKIDARIAGLRVVRGFVAAVAGGDLSALDDPDCSFLVSFMASGQVRAARRA
jgi:DNA-binding transcriptional MerR regulator